MPRRDKYGDLKPVRGKRIPIQVKETACNLQIKGDAITKHADNDQEFCYHESWVMVYPEMKEVLFIPGSTSKFILKDYKNYLGKPYSHLIFYLCTKSDFDDISLQNVETNNQQNSCSSELYNDDSLNEDLEIPPPLNLFCDASHNIEIDGNDMGANNLPDSIIQPPILIDDESTTLITQKQTLKEKLKTIDSALKNNNDTFLLSIRRKKAWLDTVQKLKRGFKNGVRPITIMFIGEEANDTGGPLKEFFSVVFEDVKNYLMCSGYGSRFTFLHDIEKLKNGEFLLLGNLFGLAILSGCAGPRCLMPCVVAKMFNCESDVFHVEDIPDLEIQAKVNAILSSTSAESFQLAVESFPERFDAGITKFKLSFDEKDLIVQNACKHFCLSKCLEEIQDVVKGMDIFGLSIALSDHPESQLEFLVCEQSHPRDVIEIFGSVIYTSVDENVSESQEKKDLEVDVFYNFSNFIESLDQDEYIMPDVIEIDEEVEFTKAKKISISDVVMFLTGSKYVLPSMKKQGVLKFSHPGKAGRGQRVVAHTCTYELNIPVTSRYYGSPSDFIQHFCEDIISAPGFGIA